MQSVSTRFTDMAAGSVRRISWRLLMAFEKAFDASTVFFQLDTSELDGPDLLAPGDSDVVQEWDKYAYTDYSDRVVSMEWSRQDELPSSVSLAIADLVLDNHDGFFTPGRGSAIDGFILPHRPLRMYAGFGGEVVQVFVGLTEQMPTIDANARTATFHCIDFLDAIFNRPLDETVLLLDVRTDEALDALFQDVGLDPSQYSLDEGINRIPIVFFEKGKELGNAVRELMDAESGRLYMDELGIIRFKNRLAPSSAPVCYFDGSNTISAENSRQDGIINVVEVRGKPRAVQDEQPVWQLATSKLIPAGDSIEIWAEFIDPVTTCDTPLVGGGTNTSYIIVRDADSHTAGSVTVGISVSSPNLFHRSYKFTVSNGTGSAVYLTEAELWGIPAKVADEVYVREQNDESVEKYDERVHRIESDFIQSNEAARSLALSILHQYSEYGPTIKHEVKGSPALQLADRITSGTGTSGTFTLTGIEGGVFESRFVQHLRATQITGFAFFVLDQSILDGPDLLAP